MYSWGYNFYGQLGTNDRTNRSYPVRTVAGGTNWKQVACGAYHTGAIKKDGTLWTCGNNGAYGALGINVFGSTVSYSSPIQVGSLTDWKQIATGCQGAGAVAAIKKDGTLWTWGNGSSGQIGINNVLDYSSPIQIPGTQ